MNKLLIGNLKMHLLSPEERDQYFKLFKRELKIADIKSTDVILCPPAIYLESFAKEFGRGKVEIGAQNLYWEKSGAYTGEISADMIKNIKAEFVIIGHSERRKYFGETEESVNLKIKVALKSGLSPIFCVGETEEERKMGSTKDVIVDQIIGGLQDIPRTRMNQIIFAYEPVWAIGSNITPSVNDIMEARLLIKKILAHKYGNKYAEEIKIVYGGSVNSKNVQQVCLEPGMDGVLIGGVSLKPYEFLKVGEQLS